MTTSVCASSRVRVLVLLALLAFFATACGPRLEDEGAGQEAGSQELGKRLVSEDEAFEMRVPQSWSQQRNLNDVAVLQAANLEQEAYALVIVDPKQPFAETTLGEFADGQVQKFLESVTNSKLSGPDLVIVNGEEALQYEIEGEADTVDVVYLYTFMETPDRFLKVVTWSLADNYGRNKAVLEAVTQSVRQLRALEEESPSPGASPGATLSPAAPSPSPAAPASPAATPSILERPV